MNQKSFSCIWIRRDDNLALFLQDLTDMHSKKSKQFIRGPVVSGILSTKENLIVLSMIINNKNCAR